MRPLAERDEGVPEVEPDVDGQLGRLPGRGETAEGPECLREECGAPLNRPSARPPGCRLDEGTSLPSARFHFRCSEGRGPHSAAPDSPRTPPRWPSPPGHGEPSAEAREPVADDLADSLMGEVEIALRSRGERDAAQAPRRLRPRRERRDQRLSEEQGIRIRVPITAAIAANCWPRGLSRSRRPAITCRTRSAGADWPPSR